MESKVGYAARKIEYGIIHPILSQSFLDRFEPLCSKLWSQCIVMFHVGRSGSTVLGDLLNQNKDILWDGEIYHPFLLELRELKKQGWNAEQDAFPFPPIKLVRDRLLLHKLTQFSKRIYGCEVKFFHLKRARIELKNYINYLESLGFSKYLILERKNYLKVIVSSLLSNQKKKSFHIPSQATTQLSRVQIDVNNLKTDGERKTLLEFLKNYRESFQTLENSLQTRRILKLTYEDDIFDDPRIGARRVCDFLEVPYRAGKTRYGKTNPFSLKEMIVNFDEVQQVLKGTPFEWMTEE